MTRNTRLMLHEYLDLSYGLLYLVVWLGIFINSEIRASLAYHLHAWLIVYMILYLPARITLAKSRRFPDYKIRASIYMTLFIVMAVFPAVILENWWIIWSFILYGLVNLSQIIFGKYSTDDAVSDFNVASREWLLIWILLAVTFLLPLPDFGLTIETKMSGYWIDHPGIPMFIGFLICCLPPTSKILHTSWFTKDIPRIS